MKYYVLDIRARKCSMLQSQSVIAPAPVFAAVMAAHALDREIGRNLGQGAGGEAGAGLNVRGIGIIHRSCQPWVEYIPNLNGYLESNLVQRRGACLYGKDAAGSAGPQQNSASPSALSDIEWTLLLACDDEISTTDISPLENQVMNMRLAGGVIERCTARSFDSLESALDTLHGGFWIDDVSHEMAVETPAIGSVPCASLHPVHALLEPVRKSSWTIPVNLGYALLEAPDVREGSRNGAAHAYAENMLGLIRYTPLAAAKAAGIGLDRLWRHGWIRDQFIVTNQAGVALNDTCVF